jgi:hypothetical protein
MIRKATTVALLLLIIFLSYAYMQHADAESACRDQAAISGSAEP